MDYKVRETVGGTTNAFAQLPTPAGMVENFPLWRKSGLVRWDKMALKGITYVVTKNGYRGVEGP